MLGKYVDTNNYYIHYVSQHYCDSKIIFTSFNDSFFFFLELAPASQGDLADAVGAVSSTRIRAALQAGDAAAASGLLGRPWMVDGVIAEGDRRGRTIGFPTINVPMGDLIRPQAGVYVVAAQFDRAGPWIGGVANLGARPTVGGLDFRLEAHLFDFDADVYGRAVAVRLLDFIRPERKFESFDALKAQIAEDAAAARRTLKDAAGPK